MVLLEFAFVFSKRHRSIFKNHKRGFSVIHFQWIEVMSEAMKNIVQYLIVTSSLVRRRTCIWYNERTKENKRAKMPGHNPTYLKAIGIARVPVPIEPFMKLMNATDRLK